MIPLGDMNLLNEIRLDDGFDIRPGRGSVTRLSIRRTYSARIKGRKSDMTVAVYQGQNAEEEWQRDVKKYSGVRHPKFLQIYGVLEPCSLYATVFHDDLISLQEIYWLCRRSALATAYLDAHFGLELWDAELYIHSITGTFLHHGSYTPWMRRYTGRLCVDLSASTIHRHILPAILPGGNVPHISIPPLPRDQDAAILDALTLQQHLEILNHCHNISQWSSESMLVNKRMKLGTLVYLQSGCAEEPIEIASIPTCELKDSGWKLRILGSSVPSKPTRMRNGWIRFDYFNIMTAGIATREIHWPHAANSWLPQANYIFSSLNITSNYEHYRIVDGIEYRLSFPNTSEVSPEDGYLFLCPLANFHASGSTRFTCPSLAAYWSLDPSGTRRLNHWRATMLGFPSVELKMKVWTRTWDENVYAGLRQFHRGKGFDPDTQDVARHMGVVLYESPWIDDQLEDGKPRNRVHAW
ncbi:hypothetical protein B0H19DRAFT_380106 [Mycena capillaripes]|nr:hypothetical protein B0H19DRAFT_380106 [Mycena capillaripes]